MAFASGYDIETVHVSDSWLRPIEANVESAHVSKVLDLATLVPVAAIPMRKHMDAKNYGAMDLKAFADDDDDD